MAEPYAASDIGQTFGQTWAGDGSRGSGQPMVTGHPLDQRDGEGALRRALHHPLGVVGAFGALGALGIAALAPEIDSLIPWTRTYWLALAAATSLLYIAAVLRVQRVAEPRPTRQIGRLGGGPTEHKPSASTPAAVALAWKHLAERALEGGDFAQAERAFERARMRYQELDNRSGEVDVCRRLAEVARRQGNRLEARCWLEQARRVLEGVGAPFLEAEVMLDLAELDLERGDDEAARANRRASAALIEEALAGYAARYASSQRERGVSNDPGIDRLVADRIAAARAEIEERSEEGVVDPGRVRTPLRRPASPRAA